MIVRILKVVAILVGLAASFEAGIWWNEFTFPSLPMYKTVVPLRLSSFHTVGGSLPAGTILYDFHVRGDVPTYLIFVTVERPDCLIPLPKGEWKPQLIAPLSTWAEDSTKRSEELMPPSPADSAKK